MIAYIPTRATIEHIEPGTLMLNCFGKLARVKEVTARGEDVNGLAYVCTRLESGTGHGTISESYKEGELLRTTDLCCKFNSHELDQIERDMKAKGLSVVITKKGEQS